VKSSVVKTGDGYILVLEVWPLNLTKMNNWVTGNFHGVIKANFTV
jgi:hypothetical protein